ncbi:MAG: AarF/ABC1/UbiB kinase family protein [Bacillota bacterium]
MVRHGFGYLLDQLHLTDFLPYHERFKKNVEEEQAAELSRGERVRLVLTDLGGTFIKFGQILSTRPDLVPKDILVELEKLQDQVPPVPFEDIKKQIENELGASLEETFEHFDLKPLAAASIGQVHAACLKDKRDVVVKVRRPGIENKMETDLEILFDLARLAEKHSALGRHYQIVEIVDEFAWGLKRELDYSVEGRNAERLERNSRQDENVKIPKVFWEYSSNKVLTMERIDGLKLTNLEAIDTRGYNRRVIAENLARTLLKQMLQDGFFHADPHPGNIAVLPDSSICFMDFGLVGYISPERKKQITRLLLALVRRDSSQIVKAILEMGVISKTTELQKLRRDMDMLISLYYSVPLGKLNLGAVIREILDLAFAHRVQIPSEMTLLAKALITLEGVIKDLDPSISIVEIAEPFAKKLLKEQFAPVSILKEVQDQLQDFFNIAVSIPKKADKVLDKTLEGDLTVKIEHQNLNRVLSYLDKMANKLSFSIVLLSFSMVMAALVIGSAIGRGGSDFFWQLPILEIAFVTSVVMFLWLLISIFRSGRF